MGVSRYLSRRGNSGPVTSTPHDWVYTLGCLCSVGARVRGWVVGERVVYGW